MYEKLDEENFSLKTGGKEWQQAVLNDYFVFQVDGIDNIDINTYLVD